MKSEELAKLRSELAEGPYGPHTMMGFNEKHGKWDESKHRFVAKKEHEQSHWKQ